jgi:hypothetical protein
MADPGAEDDMMHSRFACFIRDARAKVLLSLCSAMGAVG